MARMMTKPMMKPYHDVEVRLEPAGQDDSQGHLRASRNPASGTERLPAMVRAAPAEVGTQERAELLTPRPTS